MFSERDHYWMQHAFALAQKSEEAGEIPVGAVLIVDDKIIGESHNHSICSSDPTAHAEILALRQGAKMHENYRLPYSTLYVTLEPCLMCFGAIIHARISRLVYGAADPKTGAVHSVFQLGASQKFNHSVLCEGGLLKEPCGKILSEFFQKKNVKNIIYKL